MIKNKKGVSLIEMLIVVALLGVLTNISYIYCTGSINKAKSAVEEHNSRVALIADMSNELDPSEKSTDYSVTLYTETNFQGTSYSFYEGNTPTRGIKEFKSIKIEGNVTVILKHDNSGKRQQVIVSSTNGITIDKVNHVEVIIN